MLSSIAGSPWLTIISGIASIIAIFIFITGRESLVEILGLAKPGAQKSKKKRGKLSRSLNTPGALLVGFIFFLIAFFSFLLPSSSIINNNRYDNSVTHITSTNDAAGSKNTRAASSFSNKIIRPVQPTVIPLTGIEVLNADNSVNAGASQQLANSIINKPNPPVMQGRLLAATPRVFDSTASTKILQYKVSLTLKIFKQDGIHLCNTRFFETTVEADDITSIDKIKQQAMATFSRELVENPAGITCQ